MALHIVPTSQETDPARCRLLGPTALVVQGLMGIFVMLSLVAKRQLEKRRRPWRIWIWDVGKQLVGQAVIHALNLLISDLVAHAADNNPCSLYFLNVLIDTTFGVAIFYFSLKVLTWFFAVSLGLEGYVSGQYGYPPRPRFWWSQLVPYLLSIITMKTLVLLPLTLPGISSALLDLGHFLLDYLSPSVQVIFVMALFPLVMNVIQFCLVDQFIKAGAVALGVESNRISGTVNCEESEAENDFEDTGTANFDGEGGYQRIPTGEFDSEISKSSLPLASGSGSSTIVGFGGESRRRGSTKDNPSTPILSSSPLLLPTSNVGSVSGERTPPTSNFPDYGSTSPRPSFGDIVIPTSNVKSLGIEPSRQSKASEMFWSRLSSRGQGASGASSVRAMEEGQLSSSSSLTGTRKTPSLKDKGRSPVPSPNPSRPPSPTSPLGHDNDNELDRIPRIDLSASTRDPPATTFSAISTFSETSSTSGGGIGGTLNDNVRREARRSLSPRSEFFAGAQMARSSDWVETGQRDGEWKLEDVIR